MRCNIEDTYLVSLKASVAFTDCESWNEAILQVREVSLVYLETLCEVSKEVRPNQSVHCDYEECDHHLNTHISHSSLHMLLGVSHRLDTLLVPKQGLPNV